MDKIPPFTQSDGVAGDYLIAGGTDLYIQKGELIPDSPVTLLNLHNEMKGIERQNGLVHVGSLTTFEEFASSPDITAIIPGITDYMSLIASWQIRNRATLGGNIMNASPIGDLTILLLTVDSQLVLQQGDRARTVPITTFFKGYKQLDRTDSEILTKILIPVPSADTKIHFEKISKRKYLDIASVNMAAKVRLTNGFIEDIALAIGGVAPVPLFLKKTSDFLKGQSVSREWIENAIRLVQEEISPISDIRGTKEYKRLLARQLFIASFVKLFPEELSPEEFYEAH